jgi:NAD(P)-dependent dehydrogenase (short-subunit alcohol dehydrogenase family)
VPLGRLGNPDDMGKVAVFLVSDDSAYVSGILLIEPATLVTANTNEFRRVQGLTVENWIAPSTPPAPVDRTGKIP